jgi:hypothetical protein
VDTGFPKKIMLNKKIEHDDDSKKSHLALEHDPKKAETSFSEGIVLKSTASSGNSAAGRDGHGARDYTKGWTPSEI